MGIFCAEQAWNDPFYPVPPFILTQKIITKYRVGDL